MEQICFDHVTTLSRSPRPTQPLPQRRVVAGYADPDQADEIETSGWIRWCI